MSWEAGGEKDLAGYEVWRREDTEEKYWLLTPQPVLENTFTDTSVAKGKRYYYAICARDKSGNASDKTEVLIESLKEDGR